MHSSYAREPSSLPDASPARTWVKRDRLVNLLNRVHFRDGEILLSFRGRVEHDKITIPVQPNPCRDDILTCRWSEGDGRDFDPQRYRCEGFFLNDGLRRIRVEADLQSCSADEVRLLLPEAGYDVSARRIRRHRCAGVAAHVIQGEIAYEGELMTFSALSFSVLIPGAGRTHLDTRLPVEVRLGRGGEILFHEPCLLRREGQLPTGRTLAFCPASSRLQRFNTKRMRSHRQRPTPLPSIIFRHPLTDRQIDLRAADISGAGFSVEEDPRQAVLLPGLVVPTVRIEFMAGVVLTCRAQVLHTHDLEDGNRRCGFAIIEMDPADHIRLCSLVHQCRNIHSSVGATNLDLDALWDFFFETGFLYPEKYAFIHERKATFKELYEKLYLRPTTIARHVIYQDKGIIFGHVSMFRFYRSTWLLHHHAAITSGKHRAGLVVMEDILAYINDFHHLPSARLRYIAAYFRPANRFANRVFGGAARAIGDQGVCSLDAFAYLHLARGRAGGRHLPAGWNLETATTADLEALARSYRAGSGGLLLEGLDLVPAGAAADPELNREYAALGFTRDRQLWALREAKEPRAILALNVSDLGLNMSDLTNGIQCFVLDPEQCPPAALLAAVGRLASRFDSGNLPLLIHPRTFADRHALAYDKAYELTIVDMKHYDRYLEAIAGITARRPGAKTAVISEGELGR